jgi:hypothetical protein
MKATIDLDQLNNLISDTKEAINNSKEDGVTYRLRHYLNGLNCVKRMCKPIEEPIIFLSKTCTNNWENSKFCANSNKCEMCKSK